MGTGQDQVGCVGGGSEQAVVVGGGLGPVDDPFAVVGEPVVADLGDGLFWFRAGALRRLCRSPRRGAMAALAGAADETGQRRRPDGVRVTARQARGLPGAGR